MSKKIIFGSALIAILFLYLNSCTGNNPADNLGFNDDLQSLTDLKPVPGTDNISIRVNRGENVGSDSWFVFDVRGVEVNEYVVNGSTEGWCVEWNKPIRANNTVHENINAFSTLNNKKWSELNYFLNIRESLKEDDPELTFRDIQVVMWSLIGIPKFDLDNLADSELPARLFTENGEPRFSREKVKEIMAVIKQNSDDFIPATGQLFAVVLETASDQQNVMIPVVR
ncbi:MAG: hypothetical protein ACFCU6_11670 [Balneolaceae bacterium]